MRRCDTQLACLVSPQLFGITTAIKVKSIIEVPLSRQCFVIVISLSSGQTLESFGDGFEPWRFRRQPGSPCIGATHDGPLD
jgi:hypothetical protein